MFAFVSLKDAVSMLLPIESDAIHIYIGLFSYLLGAWAIRSGFGRWRTLLVPLVVGIVIEIFDAMTDPLPWNEVLGDTTRDMINTMIVPIVITIIARKKQ